MQGTHSDQPDQPRAERRGRPSPSALISNLKNAMDQQPQLGQAPAGAVTTPHQELLSLSDGERVDCVYVVRDRSRRPTKRGGEWLSLKLSDRSGSVTAKSWDEVEARFEIAAP